MKEKVKATIIKHFLKPKKSQLPTAFQNRRDSFIYKTEIIQNEKPDVTEQDDSDFVIIEPEDYTPYTIDEWKDIIAGRKIPEFGRMYVSLQIGVGKKMYVQTYNSNNNWDRRRKIWLYLAKIDELKAEYKDGK